MGEVFAGRYELIDLIGHGGMGSVWLVWDRRDQVHRAAKVLRQVDAESLLRFVREQATRIEHDHCVTPRGWAGEDDRVLFTMDLVRGGSVATLLGDYGALPPQWAAVLLDQLLMALAEVHAAGLVHRDVKPANLLLEATGKARPQLRLGDFGVAVPVDQPRLTRAQVVLGTSGYQAPEQVLGADPDPRQDLWATGVVLVEMLTGTPPDDDVLVPATPPSGVDPALWKLAGQLTAADPGSRPESAARARELLLATGRLPAGEAVPEDGGLDIEVLDHLPVPHGPPAGPSIAAQPVTPGPSSVPEVSKQVAWWRTRPAALGLVAVVAGVALLVAAALMWA